MHLARILKERDMGLLDNVIKQMQDSCDSTKTEACAAEEQGAAAEGSKKSRRRRKKKNKESKEPTLDEQGDRVDKVTHANDQIRAAYAR